MSATNEINPMSSVVSSSEHNPPDPAVEVAVPRAPAWAIHRRLYNWVLSLAHKKHSTTALAGLAFAESSVFPIPPDVLQIALTLERRERAFYYGFVTLVGSVLGALLGYLIGYGFWQATDDFFYRYVFSEQAFTDVKALYNRWDFWVIFVAAFTPIPFKIFTIAGGACQLSLPMFVIAAVVGRGARFFLVAGLLYVFGSPIKRFIERYFNLLCIAFTVLLIGGFVLVKYVVGH